MFHTQISEIINLMLQNYNLLLGLFQVVFFMMVTGYSELDLLNMFFFLPIVSWFEIYFFLPLGSYLLYHILFNPSILVLIDFEIILNHF